LIVEQQIAAAQEDAQLLIHLGPINWSMAALNQLKNLMLCSAGALGAAVRAILLIAGSARGDLSAVSASQLSVHFFATRFVRLLGFVWVSKFQILF
jgi:hypothetical protein